MRSSLILIALVASALVHGQPAVTTYHNDIARTGLNSAETLLTPQNVNSSTFGLLFTCPVDGQVYAQPLYLPRVVVPGKGTHNVLYIATAHNSVYAFDADSNLGQNSQPLWHVNLGPSMPYGDATPEYGITGTPVIGAQGTGRYLYVVVKTRESDGAGGYNFFNKLHALDVTTGAESLGGPATIQATVRGAGTGTDGNGNVPFQAHYQLNRPGLLLLNTGGGSSKLYIAFGSHDDQGPYHGWIFAYDAKTLQQVAVWNSGPNAVDDPSGYPIAGGGIWQAGGGVASDGSSIYFVTGNGTFDPKTLSYGDSVVRMRLINGVLSVQDYFTPANQMNLNQTDSDEGSSGAMLVPSTVGNASTPNLLVQCGKEGSIYLVNRLSMGKFGAVNNVVQELKSAIGGALASPAYWNGHVYYGPSDSNLIGIPIGNAQLNLNAATSSSDIYSFPGIAPSISSNGNTNGIVWALETDQFAGAGQDILKAYDATNLANVLYDSSTTSGRDSLAKAVKFATTTVVNGKVYVAGGGEVDVLGLGAWAPTPTITPPSDSHTHVVVVQVTDANPNALIYYTTDGSTPTPNSTLYTGQVTLTASTDFKARAYLPGNKGGSGIAVTHYVFNPVIGTGNGITGYYFNNSNDPTHGSPTATQVTSIIDFNWLDGSPIAGVAGANWAGEWDGYVMAETTGTYTFYLLVDDAARLWVKNLTGGPLVDDWSYQGVHWDQGMALLQAGVKYPIRLRYFQGGGLSQLHLYWSAPGIGVQLVPATQLSH